MRVTVSISEAKTQFSKLIRWVEAGDIVVITRRGVPVAELGPPANTERLQRERDAEAEGGVQDEAAFDGSATTTGTPTTRGEDDVVIVTT